MMCIGLSAAFDTIDHAILLVILHVKFGITNSALDWFVACLCPQDFTVNVGKLYSSRKQLTFSVPQGSCAIRFLYSVYASTVLERVRHNIEIHGYADDHAIKTSYDYYDCLLKTNMASGNPPCTHHLNVECQYEVPG